MKQLGAWGLAVLCVLLASQLSPGTARGIRHRFKWNRKSVPGTSQIPEARVAENHSGAFIKQGRKLDIDFGAEGNEYYETHYWQFPDGIRYDGCADANVTKEVFVASCINATQAANQAEFVAREKQDNQLYQRILWRLIQELCSSKHCEFWLARGAGLQVAVDPQAVLCLLGFMWLLLK